MLLCQRQRTKDLCFGCWVGSSALGLTGQNSCLRSHSRRGTKGDHLPEREGPFLPFSQGLEALGGFVRHKCRREERKPIASQCPSHAPPSLHSSKQAEPSTISCAPGTSSLLFVPPRQSTEINGGPQGKLFLFSPLSPAQQRRLTQLPPTPEVKGGLPAVNGNRSVSIYLESFLSKPLTRGVHNAGKQCLHARRGAPKQKAAPSSVKVFPWLCEKTR